MYSTPFLTGILLAVARHSAAISSVDTGTSTAITVPATVPGDAHGPIDRSFTTWSCEFVQFNETVGPGGQTNNFTENLIYTLLDVTGGKPAMRVGGTSGDAGNGPGHSAHYTPTEPGHEYYYPPSFFTSFQNIQNMNYTFQVPFFEGNATNIAEFFQAGFQYIGNDRLDSVEIGNEEDVWVESGGKFDYKAYVDRFLEYENAIIETGLITGEPRFQAIDGQNDQSARQNISLFVFPLGINNNSNIRSVTWHYYQPNADGALQRDLMNHTAIAAKMTTYNTSFQYVLKNQPQIPIWLDEVGIGGSSNDPGVAQNFGAALWAVDMQLYSMVSDVSRVAFLLLNSSHSSPFSAFGSPKVNPLYYSQQFAASFIGDGSGNGNGRPSLLNTKVSVIYNDTDIYPAYAAYDSGNLRRIALINLEEWNAPSTTASTATDNASAARPTHTFNLTLPSGISSLHVQRLQSPNGATAGADSMTWRGTQWTFASHGKPVHGVRADSFNVTVSNGVAQVPVPASEAVIAYVL